MISKNEVVVVASTFCFMATFAACSHWLVAQPRSRPIEPLKIAMPATVQLLLAFGDRYLAANVGAFRAQTVGTIEFEPETYALLAKVQKTVAQLNPRHEDNYYTAAAILAWNNQVDSAQYVLQCATQSRQKDNLPPFFLGFNEYYFHKNYSLAAQSMLRAADRSKEAERASLTNIASRWIEKGYEPVMAIRMLDGMAKGSDNPRLQFILQGRIQRLEGMATLQNAVNKFKSEKGYIPTRLEDLVVFGFLERLPEDPMSLGYRMGKDGVVSLNGTR